MLGTHFTIYDDGISTKKEEEAVKGGGGGGGAGGRAGRESVSSRKTLMETPGDKVERVDRTQMSRGNEFSSSLLY